MNITAVLIYPDALVFSMIHLFLKISLRSFPHHESQNLIIEDEKALPNIDRKTR